MTQPTRLETRSRDRLPFRDLRQLPSSHIPNILHELRNLERKTFASNEVFAFDDSLLSKRNVGVIVGLSTQAAQQTLVAYAVCVKWHHRLLLHKVCVSPIYRHQGIGHELMQEIIERARRWPCRGIDLWVDESNQIARGLYSKHDFVTKDIVQDYYSTGRNGVKMLHAMQP